MTAPNPEVSVVISCKNRSDMLRDCMRGLAAQTLGHDRFEVVLMDNCSSEDLSPVADEARAMGLDLRMVRTEQDRGPAPARNQGVLLARAPVIAFTDSDCRPTPEWLAALLPHFDDPMVALARGPVGPKPEQQVGFTTKVTFGSDAANPTWPAANFAVRRSVFLDVGSFNIALSFNDIFGRAVESADTDLAWTIIKAGYGQRYEPRALVQHELEDQSLWNWMIEPTRLVGLPGLIKRHPELRRELLTARYFFYLPSKALYVAVPVVALVAWYAPWWLLLFPAALVLRGIQRTRSLDPRILARHAGRVLGNLPRHAVLNATMLFGSIRFRCLVL